MADDGDILQKVRLEGSETVIAQLRALAEVGREALESIIPKGALSLEFGQLDEALNGLQESFSEVSQVAQDMGTQVTNDVTPAVEAASEAAVEAAKATETFVSSVEATGKAASEAAPVLTDLSNSMEEVAEAASGAGTSVEEFADTAVTSGEETKTLWQSIADGFWEGFASADQAARAMEASGRSVQTASRSASLGVTELMLASRGLVAGGGAASSQLLTLTGTIGQLASKASNLAPALILLGSAMAGLQAVSVIAAVENLAFSIGQTTESVERLRNVLVAMGVSSEQAGQAVGRFAAVMAETDRQVRSLEAATRSHHQSMQGQAGAFDRYGEGLRRVQEQYAELRYQSMKARTEGRYTLEFMRNQNKQQLELDRTWARLKKSIAATNSSIDQANANFRRLAGDTIRAGTALARFGIAVKDSSGNFRPLMDVAEEFAQRIQQIPDQTERARLALETFGAEAGRKFLEAVSQGSEAFAKFREESENMIKPLTEVEKKVAGDFSSAWSQMWAVVSDVMTRFGLKVLPVFTELVESIIKFIVENRTEIVEFFEAIFESVRSTVAGLAKLVQYTIVPAFKAVIYLVGLLVKAFNYLTGSNLTTAQAFGKLAAALLTWAVRLSVSVASYVGHAITYVEKFVAWIGQIDFKEVAREAEKYWKLIEEYIISPLRTVTTTLGDIEGTLQKIFDGAIKWIKQKWGELLEWLVSSIPEPIQAIGKYFLGIPTAAQQAASQTKTALTSVASDAKNVGDQFRQASSQVKNAMDSVNSALSSSGDSAAKAGKDMKGAADEGESSWTSWLTVLGSQLDTVISRLRQMTTAAKEAAAATQSASGATGAGYSGGGMVYGSGSGTSDSVAAWLSPGEFVVRAAAVRKYGAALFSALNSLNFRGFAEGGLVASVAGLNLSPSFNPSFSLPSFAEGGPVMSSGRPVSLHFGDDVVEGLTATDDAYTQLSRIAMMQSMARAGRRPSGSGRR